MFAKIGFDATEDESCKVCPLSVYGLSLFFLQIPQVDIGPVTTSGMPASQAHPGFAHYSGAIGILTEPFDLVMVGGRFRVGCFLKVVRHYVRQQWPSPNILFHDYINRIGKNASSKAAADSDWNTADVVEKYAERVQNAETLAVFTIRAELYRGYKLFAELERDIDKADMQP